MCNLYAMGRGRSEIVRLVDAMFDSNGNAEPQPGIYPDYMAPVVINGEGGRQVVDRRWGMPSSKQALFAAAKKRADKQRAKGGEVDFSALLKMEPDGGTTNVRNTASRHWAPWLGPLHRCLVPFTSFSEPDQVGGSKQAIWFALNAERPLAFFAGICTEHAGVRKISKGWEDDLKLFGFLTTKANREVGAVHDKAMPVILTTKAERDLWLSDATWAEVAHLQRPLTDGALEVVARGVRQDPVSA